MGLDKHDFIENELVILTTRTYSEFLKSADPASLIALYSFYYYTAKRQATSQLKCTTGFAAVGLRWSEARVRRVKKELTDIGIISDITRKDETGKITGHYILMRYMFRKENEPFSDGATTLWENHTVGNPHRGNLPTNALSDNNINALRDKEKEKQTKEKDEGCVCNGYDFSGDDGTRKESEAFLTFWRAYPKHKSKGDAEKAWRKINPKLLPVILEAIEMQKRSDNWRRENGKYIPYPASWLNAKAWEDEPDETDCEPELRDLNTFDPESLGEDDE